MNEDEVQRKRRQNDEENTERRAKLLGITYKDTRDFEQTMPLVPNILQKADMRKNHIVPYKSGENSGTYSFFITSQTPRTYINSLIDKYEEAGDRVAFFMISESAFNVLIYRYDRY